MRLCAHVLPRLSSYSVLCYPTRGTVSTCAAKHRGVIYRHKVVVEYQKKRWEMPGGDSTHVRLTVYTLERRRGSDLVHVASESY